MHRLVSGYRFCLILDLRLNGWVRDRVRVAVTSAFGVLGKKDNGRRIG